MSDSAFLLKLKIGRREFDITEADKFMDNGACVQIITRRIPAGSWNMTSPILTKKAIRDIGAFVRVPQPHKYGEGVTIFSLQYKETP